MAMFNFHLNCLSTIFFFVIVFFSSLIHFFQIESFEQIDVNSINVLFAIIIRNVSIFIAKSWDVVARCFSFRFLSSIFRFRYFYIKTDNVWTFCPSVFDCILFTWELTQIECSLWWIKRWNKKPNFIAFNMTWWQYFVSIFFFEMKANA